MSLQVYYDNIYSAKINGKNMKVLILYNISGNHYVGFPVYDKEKKNTIKIKSINKYINIDEVMDISKNSIKSLIYIKGKPLKILSKERNYINKKLKDSLVSKIENGINPQKQEDLSYIKWVKKVLDLNTASIKMQNLKPRQIYWVDFGFNVGSELRKLRPAILWRSTADKKVWTVIPLSTKCKQDNYYFHYDLLSVNDCSIKVESMMNFSYKRIESAYFAKNVKAYINDDDFNNIKEILKKYYTFTF
ncbi:MAG: type II toxin-antitoxin system PemK/MazF family toxin [Firmicutes bacterium]|nr:type II toxin-antitoxin system PemK/MazF family toxin [Bacillota bacterium]